jgi:hypothetical protein
MDTEQTEIDKFDATHGKPGPDHPQISEAEKFGTDLNPVRETPTPFTGLSQVGK